MSFVNFCQRFCQQIVWSPWSGLNWWPHPYQGCALPTELHGHAIIYHSFKPDNANDKKPSPLSFLQKPQEATGDLTFYGLPTAHKLRNHAHRVNSLFFIFCHGRISKFEGGMVAFRRMRMDICSQGESKLKKSWAPKKLFWTWRRNCRQMKLPKADRAIVELEKIADY